LLDENGEFNMTVPFTVEPSDINRLTETQLTQLLKELLHAEAYKFGIAQRSVDVALNIKVGDGGEDGRISWQGEPTETDFLPCGLTMFQNKAADMSPAGYANEVITKSGAIKPKVDEILTAGGSYIFFTTQLLNNLQKENRRLTKVKEKLASLDKAYAYSADIRIYDASQIAGWVNNFASTIASVQSWVGSPTERGLKSFDLWSNLPEIAEFPYEVVASRLQLIDDIREKIVTPKSIIRIRGLSGLGKTRTAFRVFEEDPIIQNLVIYIDANNASNCSGIVNLSA